MGGRSLGHEPVLHNYHTYVTLSVSQATTAQGLGTTGSVAACLYFVSTSYAHDKVNALQVQRIALHDGFLTMLLHFSTQHKPHLEDDGTPDLSCTLTL